MLAVLTNLLEVLVVLLVNGAFRLRSIGFSLLEVLVVLLDEIFCQIDQNINECDAKGIKKAAFGEGKNPPPKTATPLSKGQRKEKVPLTTGEMLAQAKEGICYAAWQRRHISRTIPTTRQFRLSPALEPMPGLRRGLRGGTAPPPRENVRRRRIALRCSPPKHCPSTVATP